MLSRFSAGKRKGRLRAAFFGPPTLKAVHPTYVPLPSVLSPHPLLRINRLVMPQKHWHETGSGRTHMKKLLKWLAIILIALIVIAALFYVFNRERVTRLLAVTSLFNEENIVSNFSNMQSLFFSAPISNDGDVEPFEIAAAPLPQTFSLDGQEVSTADFLDQTKATSLVVLRNGKLAFEDYYLGTKPDDLRVSWSVAKSFLSAVFGIAVAEGKIRSLDDEITEYATELKGSAYDGVTIRNALNMATGVRFNEDYLDFWSDINKMGRTLALGTSMDEFAAGISERERPQGEVRQYTSIDTHVLAMVLREATGKSLIDLVGEQIVSAIGFEKAPAYLTDGYGVAFALGGLNVTTRDYARFGQMFMDEGRWDGVQIVPREWALQSVQPSAPSQSVRNDDFGYGYQWWVPEYKGDDNFRQGEFLARGIYGQYIYVDRQTRSVIVKTSANRGFREEGNMERNLAFFRSVAGVE